MSDYYALFVAMAEKNFNAAYDKHRTAPLGSIEEDQCLKALLECTQELKDIKELGERGASIESQIQAMSSPPLVVSDEEIQRMQDDSHRQRRNGWKS